MADTAASFGKLVPGFDFLQGLMKNAGAALPGIGQWIAPTLDPKELDKRIEELRTVQFWLEQNARMLGTTIQALEVQRMTLSTLQTMNVRMDDLREAMTVRMPTSRPADKASAASAPKPAAATPPAPAPQPAAAAAPAPDAPTAKAPTAAKAPAPGAAAEGAPGVVDPMQWWVALTQQFTQLASNALKDGAQAAALSSAAASGARAEASAPAPAPAARKARPRKAAAPRKRAAAPKPPAA